MRLNIWPIKKKSRKNIWHLWKIAFYIVHGNHISLRHLKRLKASKTPLKMQQVLRGSGSKPSILCWTNSVVLLYPDVNALNTCRVFPILPGNQHRFCPPAQSIHVMKYNHFSFPNDLQRVTFQMERKNTSLFCLQACFENIVRKQVKCTCTDTYCTGVSSHLWVEKDRSG